MFFFIILFESNFSKDKKQKVAMHLKAISML